MYYAITGLGWAKDDEPVKAVERYLGIQRRNFPHLTEDEIAEAWGFVWLAPEGVTGFSLSMGGVLSWKDDDGNLIDTEPDQRVLNIGLVPEQWRLGA